LAEASFFVFLLIPAIGVGADTRFVGCTLQFHFAFAWLLAGFAAGFPLLRLAGWYLLCRRLPPAVVRGTHKGVHLPVGIALPVALVLFGWVYLPPLFAARLDADSFAGGLAAHPERAGQTLHVAGTVVAGPVTCACAASRESACQFAAVLLDLGPAGLVVARGVSDYADTVQQLVAGRQARLYGDLGSAPRPDYTTAAGACPSDPFPPDATRPRAWLEVIGF
jgi:hypothetical protein